jgi:SMODS and SLOG-associating 2TM effector domain 1/SMODS and SLOG-associating 2TM effector domain 3
MLILGAAVAAAVLAALGANVLPTWCAVAAAVAFLVSLVVQVDLARRRPDGEWYDGRAVAESVKSLAWQYAVGGGPYALANDEAAAALIRDLRAILGDIGAARLSNGDTAAPQITEPMQLLREQSLDIRREAYLEGRIGDQRSWYGVKATLNRKRRQQWLYAIVVAQVIGGTGAVLVATGALGIDVLGIAAAFVAAGIAWVQLADYGLLETAYSVAAHELGFAEQELAGVTDEEKWSESVSDAEQAISREHRLWRASRGVQMSPS